MTDQEPPRCPKCAAVLQILPENIMTNDSEAAGYSARCPRSISDRGHTYWIWAATEDDCIAQASTLALVDRKVKEAVKAEREACAKLVDSIPFYAERIRARSNPEPEKGKSDESN